MKGKKRVVSLLLMDIFFFFFIGQTDYIYMTEFYFVCFGCRETI